MNRISNYFFASALFGPMKYRKLRIAWSVVWGVAAVLLLALCVRSYKIQDSLGVNGSWLLACAQGDIAIGIPRSQSSIPAGHHTYHYEIRSVWNNNRTSDFLLAYHSRQSTGDFYVVRIPAVLTSVALVLAASWYPWSTRFSLRTLLIAMTLVAVGLGLIMWLR